MEAPWFLAEVFFAGSQEVYISVGKYPFPKRETDWWKPLEIWKETGRETEKRCLIWGVLQDVYMCTCVCRCRLAASARDTALRARDEKTDSGVQIRSYASISIGDGCRHFERSSLFFVTEKSHPSYAPEWKKRKKKMIYSRICCYFLQETTSRSKFRTGFLVVAYTVTVLLQYLLRNRAVYCFITGAYYYCTLPILYSCFLD